MTKGIIADIQRSSTHDGPGIRTAVFFKGCPLSCKWCHNPECIKLEPEILFYPDKCVGCGKCSQGCYSGAKVLCGREMTVSEVMSEILLDKPYYDISGGVTITGGEPFAQKQFLSELIDSCKEQGIHTAVETSMIYYDEEIFKKLDLVMADFKIFDSDIHRQYTGVPNEKIKEHFIQLDKLNVPIIMRTPVVPGIEQGIREISLFSKTLKNIVMYELLPYHPIGNAKRRAMGLSDDGFQMPTYEYMEEFRKYAYIR